MKVIKIIGIVIAVLILILVIAIFTLPATAHMERSIVIDATPDEVYRELITFRNFIDWSPWVQKDTAAVYEYTGPELGPGAKLSWKSNNPDVGAGSMEIIEAEKNKKVTMLMKFDGYDSSPTASFILKPVEDGTEVTWTYDETDVSGLSKIFMLGIDGFLGGDYETGLNRLKDRVESAPDFTYRLSLETIDAFTYLGITDSSANDPAMITTKMAGDYGRLISYIARKEIEATGNPVAFITSYNDSDMKFTCGIPVEESVQVDEAGILKRKSPQGLVIKAIYTGSYEGLDKAHEEIDRFAEYTRFKVTGTPWEEYVTDPEAEPDTSDWITHIYYPVE